MTRKQKIQMNRVAAKIYHETMDLHPELQLVSWHRVDKTDRRKIGRMSREALVSELTAEVLAEGVHRLQDDGVPF